MYYITGLKIKANLLKSSSISNAETRTYRVKYPLKFAPS